MTTSSPDPRPEPLAQPLGGRHALALWSAIALTFSPVVLELIRDWPNLFSAGSLLLPIAMLVRIAQTARPLVAAGLRPFGLALVFVGVVAELFGIAVGAWSIARIGLALAVGGTLMWVHGWPFRAAAIALGAVPLPAFAAVVTTPTVEVGYGVAATAMLDCVGVSVPMVGPLVGSGASILELQPAYNGLHASWMLALIGWYAGFRRSGTASASLCAASIGALLGPPIQLVATLVAVVAVASGHAGVGRLWMEQGLWLAIAIGGLAWVEIPLRSRVVPGTRESEAR